MDVMKRREFLRNMAATPLIGGSFFTAGLMLAGMKNAYAASGKTLIVIFQRGGCDGLNTVVPYREDEYYNLRPDIAIAPPSSSSASALDLDGFFGLHPAMTGLYDIFQQGDLAIMPAVHYSNASKSHFSGQDLIESGVPDRNLSDGWLNRYLPNSKAGVQLQAVSFGALAYAMRGAHPVTTINTLSSLKDHDDTSQKEVLRSIYNQQVKNNDNRALLHRHGALALKNYSIIEQFSNSSYTVENGAEYPDTDYGEQLKDIAQLVKAGVGLEVATVSSIGWDHHAYQGGAAGKQAEKLEEFSDGIAAIYKDLGSHMSNVVILTMSEFGRTVKQNASEGTDHGNAASWFAIGQQVNGGIYGDWPGLQPEQLYQDRYLAHSIEITDVYAEVLSKHLGGGGRLPAILPGSRYDSIGFLS
jgi:uncharacterized protein (DUF1501 family)